VLHCALVLLKHQHFWSIYLPIHASLQAIFIEKTQDLHELMSQIHHNVYPRLFHQILNLFHT
jgi:hypothetical protein